MRVKEGDKKMTRLKNKLGLPLCSAMLEDPLAQQVSYQHSQFKEEL
jgi:hypothetical protein